MLIGILAILLGFVSGLFWLWIFVRQDIYEPEPKGWITLIFFLGMVSIIPAIIFELVFEAIFGSLAATDLLGSFVAQFFGIGPIEETCKFLVVLVIYWNKEFDEPMDGIVYSTSAALGFATVENIMYMAQTGTTGGVIGLFFLRFFLSTLAHIFFSAMWGYKLGMRKFKIQKGVIFGLILASFLHGLYNFILTHIMYLGLLIIPFMIVMWLMMRGRTKLALRLSPFRKGEVKLVKCPHCGGVAEYKDGRCVICGKEYELTDDLIITCPRCNTRVLMNTTKCPNEKCQMKLLEIIIPETVVEKVEDVDDVVTVVEETDEDKTEEDKDIDESDPGEDEPKSDKDNPPDWKEG